MATSRQRAESIQSQVNVQLFEVEVLLQKRGVVHRLLVIGMVTLAVTVVVAMVIVAGLMVTVPPLIPTAVRTF